MSKKKLLSSYKPEAVDGIIGGLQEELFTARTAMEEYKEKVEALTAENESLKARAQEMDAKRDLLNDTIRDASVRMRAMEEETRTRCETQQAQVDRQKQAIQQSLEQYHGRLRNRSGDLLAAMSEYMDDLDRLYAEALGIEKENGGAGTVDLTQLNQPYDLQTACEELGLMSAEGEQAAEEAAEAVAEGEQAAEEAAEAVAEGEQAAEEAAEAIAEGEQAAEEAAEAVAEGEQAAEEAAEAVVEPQDVPVEQEYGDIFKA